VLITDHGYAPEYDQSATSGQYCVQFMTFERDGGEPVRRWWEERCIEWCYARFEDGKFGDQKYLDDWPYRFKGTRPRPRAAGARPGALERDALPVQPGRLLPLPRTRGSCPTGVSTSADLRAARPDLRCIYEPYVDDLKSAIGALQNVGFTARPQSQPFGGLKLLRRAVSGVYQQLWRFHQLNFRRY
jgi:hypothetical protein